MVTGSELQSTSILGLLAVLPPLFLMTYIYRQDKVEHEPVLLIIKTMIFGGIAVIPMIFGEVLAENFFVNYVNNHFSYLSLDTMYLIYYILYYFFGVALVEEGFKMIACLLSVWKNKEFNYTFDGIVYAVAASLGMALVENIEYVFSYGLSTGIVRMLTSIPGHCCFGIFMGVYLGLAKYNKYHGRDSTYYMIMALFVPLLIHGTYDFLLQLDSVVFQIIWYIVIIALDVIAYKRIKKANKYDTRIL